MSLRKTIGDAVRGAARGALQALSQIDPPAPLPTDAPAPGRSQVRRYPWEDRYRRVAHPGHGLTPQKIVQIFAAAEMGYPAAQCDLFDDVLERDPHLRSQCEQRIGSVAGKDWIIQAGGPTPEDHRAADLLQARISNGLNFGEMIAHQLRAPAYGYAASEIDWDIVDGVIAPVWFSNEQARRFRFGHRDEPRILTTQNRIDGEPLDAGRWFFTRALGDSAVRAGYMRSVTIYSYFKSLSLRDLIVFLERFGLPTAYGRYREGAPDEEKDELLEMVKMLGKDGAAVFSTASEIMIQETRGGTSDGAHQAVIRLMDDQSTKLITGSVLMADGADGGSYAQSRVQQGVRFDITLADAKALGDRFQQDVGRPFVAYNGLKAAPPRLMVHCMRDVDPMTRLQVFQGAQKLGLPISSDQVRKEHQIKAPLNDGDALHAASNGSSTT